jgi:hypothetical protein
MSKRYTVTSTQTPHGPIYQILDKVTGAVLEADWWSEKWAQRRADYMNYKELENDKQRTGNASGKCPNRRPLS